MRLSVMRLLVFGALCFWGPEIVLKVWMKRGLSGRTTLLLPLGLLCGYAFVFLRTKQGGPSRAIFMLLGALIFGPFAMMVGNTFLGYGFCPPGTVGALVVTIQGALPVYTYIASTYDGSLLALISITVISPLLHFLLERNNWIAPPSWTGHLSRD